MNTIVKPKQTSYAIRKLQDLGFHPDTVKMDCFWKPRFRVPKHVDSAVICQWFSSPFTFDGVRFPTAEHAMMYAKAKLMKDVVAMAAILEVDHPADAKAIGRQVKPFDILLWEEHRYDIVRKITRAKFTQNPRLLDWLLKQPDDTVFVEASPYDSIWGNGLAESHPACKHPATWKGMNLLGFIATEIRMELKALIKQGHVIHPYIDNFDF